MKINRPGVLWCLQCSNVTITLPSAKVSTLCNPCFVQTLIRYVTGQKQFVGKLQDVGDQLPAHSMSSGGNTPCAKGCTVLPDTGQTLQRVLCPETYQQLEGALVFPPREQHWHHHMAMQPQCICSKKQPPPHTDSGLLHLKTDAHQELLICLKSDVLQGCSESCWATLQAAAKTTRRGQK